MHIFALYHLLSKETIGQVFTVVGHWHCLQSMFVQLTSATHALLSCVKGWYDCNTVKHVIPLNTIFLCFFWSLSYWQSQQQIVRFEHTQSALGRATDRRYQNTEIFGKVPQGRDLERGLFEHERKKMQQNFPKCGVIGRLKLFRKFIRLGTVTRPFVSIYWLCFFGF